MLFSTNDAMAPVSNQLSQLRTKRLGFDGLWRPYARTHLFTGAEPPGGGVGCGGWGRRNFKHPKGHSKQPTDNQGPPFSSHHHHPQLVLPTLPPLTGLGSGAGLEGGGGIRSPWPLLRRRTKLCLEAQTSSGEHIDQNIIHTH